MSLSVSLSENPGPSPLVGPEFQIFTPLYLVGFLNGMSELTRSGVSFRCHSEGGLGIQAVTLSGGHWRQRCPQGKLEWGANGTDAELLQELDLLLAGGRMTQKTREVVARVLEHAPASDKASAAQQAITMTAEFNTMGPVLPKAAPRPRPVEEVVSATRPYKALVVVFLAGGADTFNLLVPTACPLYQEYRNIRTDLALAPGELIGIQAQGQACGWFGVHGSFRFLKSLYDQGQAAFVSNVGNLVEPLTKQQFKEPGARRCFGLFSHSDQQKGTQTLRCQEAGTVFEGSGGRMADALAAGLQNFRTASFSLAGTAVFSEGVQTPREIVDDRGTVFNELGRWRQTIGNITAQQHGNAYSEAYTLAFRDSLESAQKLGQVLGDTALKTHYQTPSYLARKLQQVSKLIAAHASRGAERDFFFISIPGWDHHGDMKSMTAAMFGDIDKALEGFVREMQAQGAWDRVALVTESEFGRTLDSNGGGSDHAWAGNHFIASGSLKGRRVFNKFPASLKPGNDRDLGRGRLIPDFPWESVLVPVAEWMGLEKDQLGEAFPNIRNFNSSHVIPTGELFK